MNQEHKKASLWILVTLLLAFALSACKSKPPAEPTLDANQIFTQAAATVAAQLTETALSIPTATNTPTPEPTATVAVVETTAPVSTNPAAEALTTPTVADNAESTSNPNKMVFVSDITIPDGQIVPPGSKFVKIWRIKNTGTTTWSPNYKIRLWAGNSYGAPKSALLGQEVKPNMEVDISIEFSAPLQNGEYISHWILSDENEANFGTTFYCNFVVGVMPSPSPTP